MIEQSLKLRLLALVLALVLFWYSVNPAPYTAPRRADRDNQPDPKKLPPQPQIRDAAPSLQLYGLTRPAALEAKSSAEEEPDDFDWPEFIDG